MLQFEVRREPSPSGIRARSTGGRRSGPSEASTGWSAYALLLGVAVEHLDVPEDGGVWLELEYEHLGQIRALVLPLGGDG